LKGVAIWVKMRKNEKKAASSFKKTAIRDAVCLKVEVKNGKWQSEHWPELLEMVDVQQTTKLLLCNTPSMKKTTATVQSCLISVVFTLAVFESSLSVLLP
jgi:hypothetical protein